MIFVIIGAVGFVIHFLFDIAAIKNKTLNKKMIWILGNCLKILKINNIH